MSDKQAREVHKLTRKIAFHFNRANHHRWKIIDHMCRVNDIADQKMDLAPSVAFEIAMKQYQATIDAIHVRIKDDVDGANNGGN